MFAGAAAKEDAYAESFLVVGSHGSFQVSNSKFLVINEKGEMVGWLFLVGF
jgi:hypothetical protein